jgi:hypothetical protein
VSFSNEMTAVVARAVLSGQEPVRYAAHTPDDDWWLSDGRTNPKDAHAHVVAHISHVTEHDPTVHGLASLPLGHEAHREAIGEPWELGPFEWPDEDAPA